MYIKYRFFTLFVIFILVFSVGINLYAQESNDLAETPEAMGTDYFEPSENEIASLLTQERNPAAIVGPLIQTRWNQGAPYNNLFPLLPNNSRASSNGRLVTDCVTTAIVQIMAFHKHPVRGNGQSTVIGSHNITVPSVNFNAAYDWNNMLNVYPRNLAGVTQQQQNAVATLMYHFSMARGLNTGLTTILTTNFGYDRNIQLHYRSNYTDAEWESIIRQQLDARLPVFYYSRREGGGHGFVVDGYDNAGKFHINWGWGGLHDGWYSLNALTPGTRNYDREQYIITNIKPDAGGTGSNDFSLTDFTASKTSVFQNEMFTVSFRPRSIGFFPGGQVGAALVDNSGGRIVAVIGTRNRSALNSGSLSGALEINCFVPETVNAGQYSLRIVTRPEGGDWKIVTISDISNRIPNAINFTVTAETGTPGGGYGLALTNFTASKTTVTQNELFTVVVTPRNVGIEQFPGGQVGIALVDNNRRITAVIGIANRNALNPGSTGGALTINCFVPETIRAGSYRLMAVVRPADGEWRIAMLAVGDTPSAINVTVNPYTGATPGGGYGLALTAFTASRTSVPQNELFTVTPTIRNVAAEAFPGGQLGVALVDTVGNITEVIGIRARSSLNSGSASNPMEINCYVPETIRPGQYRMRIVVRPEGGIWRIATLSMPDIPNIIPFTVTAGLANGGGYGMALTAFSASTVSVSQNERFTVTATPRNVGLDAFPGGQIGAALVDNNSRIVEVIGTRNRGALNSGLLSGALEINCTVPNTVRPGQYRLRIVFRPTGGEWRIATMSIDNAPNSIEFTVR